MASRKDLVDFVRRAREAGHTMPSIRGALTEAGWTARDADWAIAHFAAGDFVPPIPRPRPAASARDAYLYGLMFFALVLCVFNVTWLMFEVIDWWVSDAPLTIDRVSWELSLLLVFGPLFVWMDRRAAGDARDNPARQVFGYVALFLASVAVLMTVTGVLALALSGGLVHEIFLKALVSAFVAAAIFLYYRRDLQDEG